MTIEYKKQLYANNASTTLTSALGYSDTNVSVLDGSRFPQPAAGEFFLITLDSGVSIEIIEVRGRLGNILTNCVRGRENTTPQLFQTGTRVENRVTADTLTSFARLIDRNAPVASLADLTSPELVNGNSYIVGESDDSGVPVLAISSGLVWKFPTFPVTALSNVLSVPASVTSVPFFGIDNFVWLFRDRSFIIQFTTGANRGQCRFLTEVLEDSCSWHTPLPHPPQAGDRFEVYQSTSSRFYHVLPEVIDLGSDYDSTKSFYSGTYLGLTNTSVYTTDGGYY